MKTETVFVPVDVNDRLPEESGNYFVQERNMLINNGHHLGDSHSYFYFNYGTFDIPSNYRIESWLEKKDDVFVLTKEEMEKIIQMLKKCEDRFDDASWDANIGIYSDYAKEIKGFLESLTEINNSTK